MEEEFNKDEIEHKEVTQKILTATPSKVKRVCSKCGSGQTYVRIKEGSIVCRYCGNIDKIKEDG